MIQVISALLLTGAFALSLGVMASMLAAEWRRIAGLLLGDRALVRTAVPAPAPIRMPARRLKVAPGPTRSMLQSAAA